MVIWVDCFCVLGKKILQDTLYHVASSSFFFGRAVLQSLLSQGTLCLLQDAPMSRTEGSTALSSLPLMDLFQYVKFIN